MIQRIASIALMLGLISLAVRAENNPQSETLAPVKSVEHSSILTLVEQYCFDCHSGNEPSAGFDLAELMSAPVTSSTDDWEKVVKKLRGHQMPPAEALQPQESERQSALKDLERILDQHAKEHPQPGRTETFRRLTRYEYKNAIRDLLGLNIDVEALLPADEVSHGFDNVTVGELSPTLLNRYITAAQKISRLAVGRAPQSPGGKTYRVRPDVTQEQRMPGLPFGTRGGTSVTHFFPVDGVFEIRVRLARDRNEAVEGLREPHEMEFLLDRKTLKSFTVEPPNGKSSGDGYQQSSHANVDRHLVARVQVSAGDHDVAATFLKLPSSLLVTKRQPLNVHYNMYRHPRLTPAIYQLSINGPFEVNGPGETPSRRKIFSCRPETPKQAENCARKILSRLMRVAIRRPTTEEDLERPMTLFRETFGEEGFEAGIEMALSSILVHPEFLFRIEETPDNVPAGTPYTINDLELASRLSFFLWSSLPDEELLTLAERGRLSEPSVLEQQTLRMLADDRSQALVDNFASQWLYLRNLESITPDARLYPDFGDNLRQAFRRETELCVAELIREDRSVLELLDADSTYLNERLAKHYGIPHVFGTYFRRVDLEGESRRGGLLRHGSVLTVTSYATRTSPVIRGKWILENLLGTPPPPPPPNVSTLQDNTVSAKLPVRERLAQHRADAACASCHNLIDPVGFSLEHFDAVGRWRDLENGRPVDATGGLPDGREFVGVDGLEAGLLEMPDVFVGTMTEKLLTYALGRGVETHDAPAIREIVRNAAKHDYRFSSIILGIGNSTPFQMRMSP
ncbi:MAG: DUF1592 domain-containing protein [Planctomycetaceae bacterium]|nr:DUF1592 domain-containing protein [Planctomycetaceae bacterium]